MRSNESLDRISIICATCDMGVVDDEQHFLVDCRTPELDPLRVSLRHSLRLNDDSPGIDASSVFKLTSLSNLDPPQQKHLQQICKLIHTMYDAKLAALEELEKKNNVLLKKQWHWYDYVWYSLLVFYICVWTPAHWDCLYLFGVLVLQCFHLGWSLFRFGLIVPSFLGFCESASSCAGVWGVLCRVRVVVCVWVAQCSENRVESLLPAIQRDFVLFRSWCFGSGRVRSRVRVCEVFCVVCVRWRVCEVCSVVRIALCCRWQHTAIIFSGLVLSYGFGHWSWTFGHLLLPYSESWWRRTFGHLVFPYSDFWWYWFLLLLYLYIYCTIICKDDVHLYLKVSH